MDHAGAMNGTSKEPRAAAALLGVGVGGAAGAALLGGYGFVRRTPSGVHEASVNSWACGSLVLLTAAVLALIWIARSALRADETKRSSLLLTSIAVVAAYAVLAEPAGFAASTRPALALLRLSWVVVLVAAVFVVAGAVSAAGRTMPARPRLIPAVVTAVVVGLVLALAPGALVRARTDTAVTAAARDIPATPSTVGADIAYSLPTDDPSSIVPAGPGFVMLDGDAVVGYAGDTGQQRWRLPFDVVGLDCAPTSVRSTGTSADSVVIAQCVRADPVASYLSSPSERPAVLTGIDAMTGRVLWTNGDNWRVRSTAVTGPDVVPVLRDGEVGGLEPHSGKLLWTKQFDQGSCAANVVGLDNQEIVYFPRCAHGIVMHIVDGRTGAERTLKVESPELEAPVVRTELVAAAGSVIVIDATLDSDTRSSAALAVDVASGETVAVPVDYLSTDRDSWVSGQYPGPVLQLTDASGTTTVYLVAERRVLETSAPTIDTPTSSRQRWAVVGNEFVTATAVTAGYRTQLATVTADGTATGKPSPCGGTDPGGVVPVPGAVLVVCERTADDLSVNGYDVIGLR